MNAMQWRAFRGSTLEASQLQRCLTKLIGLQPVGIPRYLPGADWLRGYLPGTCDWHVHWPPEVACEKPRPGKNPPEPLSSYFYLSKL